MNADQKSQTVFSINANCRQLGDKFVASRATNGNRKLFLTIFIYVRRYYSLFQLPPIRCVYVMCALYKLMLFEET